MRTGSVVASLAASALGVAAVLIAVTRGSIDALDQLAGWSAIIAGTAIGYRRAGAPAAVLLTAFGGSWFLGNLAALGGAIGWVGAATLFLHRGILIHLLIAFPQGRITRRGDLIAVVAGYAVSVTPTLWAQPWFAITAVGGFAAFAVLRADHIVGRVRIGQRWATVAAAAFALNRGRCLCTR